MRDLTLFGICLHAAVDDAVEGSRRIRERLALRGLPVERIEAITPSLEDVFIHLLAESEKDG